MSAGKTALKALGISAGVAAGVAGGAYAAQRTVVRNLRHRPDPDAGKLGPLRDVERRTLPSHDDGTIATFSRGDADSPTILFAHGVTLTSRVWVKQFDSLPKAGVRIVAFDHRGHGDSVCGTSGHSVENLGRDMLTVLEELDLRDTVVVGHSMGGIALEELAIRHAKPVEERVARHRAALEPREDAAQRGPPAADRRRAHVGEVLARIGDDPSRPRHALRTHRLRA